MIECALKTGPYLTQFCINLHGLAKYFAHRHSNSFNTELNKKCTSPLATADMGRGIYKSFGNNTNLSLLVEEKWEKRKWICGEIKDVFIF